MSKPAASANAEDEGNSPAHRPDRRQTQTPQMPDRTYWIGVVSRSHVQIGVKGGFIQLSHGKKAPLRKFRAGDGLIMYSPRISYPDGEPLQSFTAIGTIASGDVYQVEMAPDFKPYRIDVRFSTCKETPIKPLLGKLSFITNKTHWGAAFRFGQVQIPAADFALIADAMGCSTLAKTTLTNG